MSDPPVYEDIPDMEALKTFMETQLEDYNMMPGVVAMSLVLFRYAIEHSESENTQSQNKPIVCVFYISDVNPLMLTDVIVA